MPAMDYKPRSQTFYFSIIFYFLLIIGVSLQIGGSNWDIVWHGSKKVESFLTPPHAIIYSGVAITVGGIVSGLYFFGIFKINNSYEITSFQNRLKKTIALPFPFKLSIIGSILQITAGPFDFWWHTRFGFDGLLSPPHSVLATGMLLLSLGAMFGIYQNLKTNSFSIAGKLFFLISCGISLLVSIDIVLLFTLPFSKGQYFNFNPEPFTAMFEAIILIPFIMNIFFSTVSSSLKIPFTFTIMTSVIITIQASSTIVSNSYFIGIFPYYILNIIPALFIDLILLKYNINKIDKKSNTISLLKNRFFIASTILSLLFIPLFFPWTGDVFGGFFKPSNEIRTEDFLFQILFPVILPVVIPVSFASSLIGLYSIQKIIKNKTKNK